MFPGRALVALYGHPTGGSLGALGEQGPDASVARAKQVAAPLQKMRSGRAWPRFHFGRLPQAAPTGSVQAVDAPTIKNDADSRFIGPSVR